MERCAFVRLGSMHLHPFPAWPPRTLSFVTPGFKFRLEGKPVRTVSHPQSQTEPAVARQVIRASGTGPVSA